ncbi:DUF3800 domain-containing protein [Pyrodictium abyssi]|uniref:DUF3800 domain-containing protein n=1 Tax=Pyrodictium abyssi TaxID=54256 RepID=A0ABN6ZSW2_9CREN|nr:hypothetical protein PABY_12770 [Pyrodictium abyssi]
MERYVCFMDESASGGMRTCSWLCMAVVCFARGSGGVEKAGLGVYRALLKVLGWRQGELKWRKARRAARQRGLEPGELVRLIRGAAAYAEAGSLHIGSSVSEARLQLAARLLEGAVRSLGVVSLAVLDQGLVPERDRVLGRLRRRVSPARLRRVVFRSSARTVGIQLADILAGYECTAREPQSPQQCA